MDWLLPTTHAGGPWAIILFGSKAYCEAIALCLRLRVSTQVMNDSSLFGKVLEASECSRRCQVRKAILEERCVHTAQVGTSIGNINNACQGRSH
jgi:hypothetical protein